MANEEVARAYQEYMNSGVPADTYAQQYPYYYPIAPAAPTPPYAGPPTVESLIPPPLQHIELPRTYAENPAVTGYTVGWQYEHPVPPPLMGPKSTSVRATAGSHGSKSVSDEIYEAKTRENWKYSSYYESTSPAPVAAPVEPAQRSPIPVLLCHTCVSCGRMRSAGFHRSNPVIPGEDTIQGTCRRCRRKQRKHESGVRMVTHVRKCVADEPCDWPDRSIRIQIDRSESRGRRRNRECEEAHDYGRYRSISPPRVVKRRESIHNVGLSALQPNSTPHEVTRRKTELRYLSPSPARERVRIRHMTEHRGDSESITPPMEYMPPLREALIPPPPVRLRARSVSLSRHREQEGHNSGDAQYKLAGRSMVYRSVHPNQRGFVEELDDAYSPLSSPARVSRTTQSPSGGILKPPSMTRETDHRRHMGTHESQESTRVEAGSPHVQFIHDSLRAPPRVLPDDESEHVRFRTRRGGHDGQHSNRGDFDYYHRHIGAANPYLDTPPARRPTSPPARALEEFHIRHVSPKPINPRRGGSPVLRADGLPRTQSEERRDHLEYRHVRRRPQSPPPQSSERIAIGYRRDTSGTPPPGRIPYRTITRPALLERESEPPMLMQGKKDWDEITASGSEEGDLVSMRTWRGRDDRGEMATFVEERTTRTAIPRGGRRKVAEYTTSGNWRNV